MNFRVFLLMVLLFVQAPGLAAEARESHEEVIPVFVNPEPTNLVTDPPTCQLNNKNGLVHQVLCYGETFKIKATSSDENAAVQWFRQNNTGNWAAVTGATNVELTTGKGIYKAIFTFGDSSTCETSTDTIEYWKAFQIDWQVAACRAGIVGATALPFPQQLTGEGELSTPVDPQAEINYSWQVIPEPVQASFPTSSNSVYSFTDGFFQDTTLGLHQVVLTVSQYGSECVSVDTMEVTLLPLKIEANPILITPGLPSVAAAYPSGGTAPYTFNWNQMDSCLNSGCSSISLSNADSSTIVFVSDGFGCSNSYEFSSENLPDSLRSVCPLDSIIQTVIGLDSSVIDRLLIFEEIIAGISDSIDLNIQPDQLFRSNNFSPFNREIVIPTVIHFFSNKDSYQTSPQLSREFFERQIVQANTELIGSGIRLCLVEEFPSDYPINHPTWAKDELNNSIKGVMLHRSADAKGAPQIILDDFSRSVQFPPGRYFNIFVYQGKTIFEQPGNDPCGLLGSIPPNYGSVPGMGNALNLPMLGTKFDGIINWDGVQISSLVFGFEDPDVPLSNPIDYDICQRRGGFFMHEMGHYLNLYHTFMNFLESESESQICTLSSEYNSINGTRRFTTGDRVGDTPFEKTITLQTIAPIPCAGTNYPMCFGEVPPRNFMSRDYRDQVFGCTHFSTGQLRRMRASLFLFRPQLISNENMFETGIANTCGSNLDIVFEPELGISQPKDRSLLCVNENVSIRATRALNANYNFFYRVNGGLYASCSTVSGPIGSFQAVSPGLYDIKVEITVGGFTYVKEENGLFRVEPCDPIQGGKHWYFGRDAGLSFSDGLGKPLTTSKMFAVGQSNVIHKRNGSTYFYSNGKSIFSENSNLTLPDNLLPFSPSSSDMIPKTYQGFLTLPFGQRDSEGNFQKFSIVSTTDNFLQSNNSIRSHGLTAKNIQIDGNGNPDFIAGLENAEKNYRMSAQLMAIPHWDKDNYWIITHGINLSPGLSYSAPIHGDEGQIPNPENKLFVYLSKNGKLFGLECGEPFSIESFVSTATISQNPLKENVATLGQIRSAKTSDPNINRLALINLSGIYFYTFNKLTGLLTSTGNIANPSQSGVFSPDGNIFYFLQRISDELLDLRSYSFVTGQETNPNIQFRGIDFLRDDRIKPDIGFTARGSLQLGPDGRIYISVDNATTPDGRSGKLSVISNPNLGFPGATFIRNAIDLIPGLNTLGLPQFVDDYLLEEPPLTPEISPFTVAPTAPTYCSGQIISVDIDIPANTVNRWMWDVCLLTPGVDPGAIVSSEYGHFDGTSFQSSITNHGEIPIQVRFQVFASKDNGDHYVAPEIFIVTIQPEITHLTVVGNCGGNTNLVGQLHAQTNLTVNENVSYRWFQTSPTAPNGITLLEGQGENIFEISPLNEGRYGVEVKNEGCQPAPYYFYHRPSDLAWTTPPSNPMTNEDIYFTGSNPRIGEAEFDHCNLYFFGFTNTTTNVPGGEVLGQFLRVSENGTLTLSNSTVQSACENMWGGILMEEGAQIEATNSTIKDARWAVDADGVTAGCVMTACTLANNLNGVRLNHWISEGFSFTENIITSNYLQIKRPYDYHTNSGINNLGLNARFITQKGLQLGYLSNFVTGSLNGNVFENCLIGLETGIRTSGVGPVATVDYNQFSNCTWKGANTAGYGINFSHCWFGFPTDPTWVNTWQSQTFRGLTFGPNQEQQSVYGIFNKNGGTASGLGTVSNCNFYSAALPGSGDPLFIGINAEAAVAISGNAFEKLSVGIDLEAVLDQTLIINGNKFLDNLVGIDLEKSNPESENDIVIDFTLKCNQFRLSCAEENVDLTDPDPCGATGIPLRMGLVIEEGVQLKAPDANGTHEDVIGGSGSSTSNDQYPNANQWPVRAGTVRAIFPGNAINNDIQRSTIYPMPEKWISLINHENNNEVTYWRYHNEFVHNHSNQIGFNIYTLAIATDVKTDPSSGQIGDRACLDFPIDDFDIFPFARIAVLDSLNLFTGAKSRTTDQAWLGDATPNPASHEAVIKAYIPKSVDFAVLQFVELSSGKVLSGKLLEQRGSIEMVIDCRKTPSGVYGYQLLVNGKSIDQKKLVVLK